MSFKTLTVATALALSLSFGAQAQSDPVADQYRAYQAALERGDRTAAETAAAAALVASEARDRDGGQTAVLAANLAQVRLDRGRAAEALAPAQRALQIAERNPSTGVSATYASFLVGQAELVSAPDDGQRRILAALTAARGAGGENPEAYEAAVVLGEWALRNDRAAVARDAFDRALAFSIGGADSDNVLRARAHLGKALAASMTGQDVGRRNRTGTRLAAAPDQATEEAFAEALRLSRPIAQREAATGRMTRAQVTYGAALAWSLARSARLAELDWIARGDASDRRGLVVGLNGATPGCTSMVQPDPVPAYDVQAMRREIANAAVVRVQTDASGAIVDRRLVGSTGDQAFVAAVNAALPQWQFAGTCAGARVVFTPVLITTNDEQMTNTFTTRGGGGGYVTRSTSTERNNGLLAIVPE